MLQRWFAILAVAICSTANAQDAKVALAGSSVAEANVDADPRLTQMQAATTNGAAALREQVLRMRLTRDLDVRNFIDKTHSSTGLTEALQSAQPAGGPRWVDDQTCQVQLEIPGSQVAKFLQAVARNHPEQSLIEYDVLATRLVAWDKLKFSAVGSSAGGDSIDLARPRTTGKWAEIDDPTRRHAVEQAQADAVHQVIKAIGPIYLDAHLQISDAMAQPAIADRVITWLNRQPITRIEFSDDLKVSVTITLSPRTFGRVLKSAVIADPEFVGKGAPIDWDRIRTDVEATPAFAVGTASAAMAAPASSPTIALPLQPPDWVDQQLAAEATARGGGSRLKVGRAAESQATDRIKSQFLVLPLDANTTLGDAVRSDPRLADAVTRAMRLAHTCKVDYQPDGDVHVRVSLDLHEAWDELRGNP